MYSADISNLLFTHETRVTFASFVKNITIILCIKWKINLLCCISLPFYSYIVTLERYQHYRNKQNKIITFQTNIKGVLKRIIQYELIHFYIVTQKPMYLFLKRYLFNSENKLFSTTI